MHFLRSSRARCIAVLLGFVARTPTTGAPLPYYHPTVHHIAFRQFTDEAMRIEAVPFLDTPIALDSRLYRISTSLLETVHRYCSGNLTQWQKRVHHDRLIPREEYQDLYLTMRERYQHVVREWKEETDPLKHCYEEIGIACYLMLLWRYSFATDNAVKNDSQSAQVAWHLWPRPPGGFLDLGCGAGLLTHVLVSEGYMGHGVDVRARRSWASYAGETTKCLHVHALHPPGVLKDNWVSSEFFPDGVFLIGNHSDELTPWLPVLATLSDCSGYLSIPCCPWTLDTKFRRGMPPLLPPIADSLDVALLHLPASENSHSTYEAYRIYLGKLSLVCGFEILADNLRLPSTKNWGLVGLNAKRRATRTDVLDDVRRMVADVAARGSFAARKEA